MSRAKPKDGGAEGRWLVAAVYIASRPETQHGNAATMVEMWTDSGEDFDTEIRAAVVAAVVKRWPELDAGYVGNIIRGVCSGGILASPLWRGRLEELSGGKDNG